MKRREWDQGPISAASGHLQTLSILTVKRTLTNSHQDCQLIKLDAREPRSPLVVAQEGCAPNDALARTRLFYLQRDGQWIDEVARSTRPDSEAGDIIFETASE